MELKKFKLPLITLGAVFILGACGTKEESGELVSDSVSESVSSDSSGTEVETTNTLSSDGYFKELVYDGVDPKIKDIVSYKTDFKNADWDDITLDIEHAKIVNVDEYKDNENNIYKELISFKYKLTNENSEDKHITPDKAVIVLEDGSEVDAKVFNDYWNDEVLTKDKHKDGYLYFKVKEENSLDEIKSMKLTFKAKDSKDVEVEHTYTVDLPIDVK